MKSREYCPICKNSVLQVKVSCWFEYNGECLEEPTEFPIPLSSDPVKCSICDWSGICEELGSGWAA